MKGKIKLYIKEKRIGLIFNPENNENYYFFPESLPDNIRDKKIKLENVEFDIAETVRGKQAINIKLRG